MVVLDVDLVAAIRTLDDTIEREPLDGGGLDLIRTESAIPELAVE